MVSQKMTQLSAFRWKVIPIPQMTRLEEAEHRSPASKGRTASGTALPPGPAVHT